MAANTSAYPLDTVVYVRDTIGGVAYQASGVLIAPDMVLTASHVVYTQGVGTASAIQVAAGYSSGTAPYGWVGGTSFDYNAVADAGGMITQDQSQYDFAVIKLAQPIGVGTMGMRANWAGGAASVTGYPATSYGAQVTAYESFVPLFQYAVYDGTALGPGSSGGPVWIERNNAPQVVGLVSSGDGTSGTFVALTASDISQITGWENTLAAACFATGTRIATSRGEIPVEHLREGDLLPARFGGPAPVVWIGRRRIDCRRHPDPARVWPVRVARDAFAPGEPIRDLRLSPDHAVFVGGRLVPVRHLLNGATIAQEPADTVTYFHVELPRHDVILAEGLAVESYLDSGNRGVFDNGGPALVLHPGFGERQWRTAACAPLLRGGTRLDAIRRRLHARARVLGYRLTADPALKVLAHGRQLPVVTEGTRHCVGLPAGCTEVRLCSRAWVPAHSLPQARDTRRLGVAIGRLWRDGREVGLDSPRLARGWHPPEADGRWTDGDAVIPVDGARTLGFTLAMAGAYWLAPDSTAGDEAFQPVDVVVAGLE